MAAGWPGDSELMFPGKEGQPWTQAAYGPEVLAGQPHIVWRRIGTHDIFRRP
jgi:hypothetical protein